MIVSPTLHIVYQAYINESKNWENIIIGQLQDAHQYGLFRVASISVEITAENKAIHDVVYNIINDFLAETAIYHAYDINIHSENHFEYYAFKKIHEVAASSPPDTIILYYHSKCMFARYLNIDRHDDEKRLTRNTLFHWEHILDILNKQPQINKVGLFPSTAQWVWFNFFFIRSSTIRDCNPPIVCDENRWYYESYIVGECHAFNNDARDTYALYGNDPSRLFTAEEACYFLQKLPIIFLTSGT